MLLYLYVIYKFKPWHKTKEGINVIYFFVAREDFWPTHSVAAPVVESSKPASLACRLWATSQAPRQNYPYFLVDWMFPKAKILRLNALHRLQEPQSNWFQNNLMTTKLAIKFAVFCRDLTLVAKYAFSQALSHLEIWLQVPGGILQPGS